MKKGVENIELRKMTRKSMLVKTKE